MKTLLSIVVALLLSASAFALGPNGISASLTVQNANGNSGLCTSGSCAQAALHQGAGGGTIFTGSAAAFSSLSLQVTGTWVGTITFQYTQDEGATWTTYTGAYGAPLTAGLPYPVSSTTANGNWVVPVQGLTTFRAVMSAFTSGTAVVAMEVMTQPVFVAPMAVPNASRRTYSTVGLVTVPTAAGSLMAIEAGAANRYRIRSVCVGLVGAAIQTAAGHRQVALYGTTAASTGGATQVPNVADSLDAAFTGIVRTGAITTTPAIGAVTQANALWGWDVFFPATTAVQAAPSCMPIEGVAGAKQLTVNAGVANGIAVGDLTGGAGGAGSYLISVIFTEEAT